MTSQTRAIIHECGHVIIARIFSDVFTITFVTVDPLEAVQHDLDAAGGMRGRLVKPFNELKLAEHDKLCIIFLAGMASDDLANNSGLVTGQLINEKNLANKITMQMYSGDMEIIARHYSIIKENKKDTFLNYTQGVLSFLYSILSNDIVSAAYEKLYEALSNSSDKRLSSEQIEQVLYETNLDEWIANNSKLLKSRNTLFEEQQPVIKHNLLKRFLLYFFS